MAETNSSEVTMVLDTLASIPRYTPPAGFLLRLYKPGDEVSWYQIQYESDRYNDITTDLFYREFGTDLDALPCRQLYAVDEHGKPVGTATAWFDNNFQGQSCGRIHWMAVVPSLQGIGLGKALLSRACELLRELGHARAYLTTSPLRIPAVSLYMRFGFTPLTRCNADRPPGSA